jgi:hypothetical protein
MAIPTGAPVDYFGTAVTVTDTTSAVATTAFSVVGDTATWTNTDNVLSASVVGTFTMTGSAANGTIALYAKPLNILSTNDATTPNANYLDKFVGVFNLSEAATVQYPALEISTTNIVDGQEYEFYIKNNMAVSVVAGWELELTPKAIAGKA